jgi:hypothetical protein
MNRSAFESLLVERAGRQKYPYLACDALFASFVDGAARDPLCILMKCDWRVLRVL